MALEESGGQSSELADRCAVSALLSSYYAAIDDKRLDESTVASIFAVDGQLTNPSGDTHSGRDTILKAQIGAFSRFRATHHVTSDHLVDVDGDTAWIRANMTAMHIWMPAERDDLSLQPYFVAGGVFTADAQRTLDGWRLRQLTLRITWRTGSMPFLPTTPPATTAETSKDA